MESLNLLGRHRWGLFLIVFTAMLFLNGCGSRDSGFSSENIDGSSFFNVYYINNAGTKIQPLSYQAEAEEKGDLIKELLAQLSKTPENIGLKQPLPEDISLLSFSVNEDNLNLHFGEEYKSLIKVDEVLRRAAVVKTLTQIKGVHSVSYIVGEQPLLYTDMVPVGKMKADDFIDNTGGETTYYQTVHLTLYYTDEAGKKLIPARHNVEFDGTISLENLVLKQLISGPLPEENLMKVIPEGTKINKVSSKDGVCYVDVSREFLTGLDGISNQVIIYSIVNSLSEIGTVTKVIFTVDGEALSSYRGEVPLDIPLERKLEIIGTN